MMTRLTTRRILQYAVLLAGFALMLQSPATAAAQDSDYDDPPDRVARMNFSQGSVSFQPGNEEDWVDASPNRPLTVGDNLWADRNSRAELHIGSTALRLDSETSLSFLDLRDQVVQLRLSEGGLFLHIPQIDQGDVFEVDTPNTAFTLQQPGDYRLDVNRDGSETLATVWRGRGEAVGGGYSYTVDSGQQARFSGTDQLNYDVMGLPRSDDFDNWAFDRDRRDERSESRRYVSPEVTGYEDLDQYGRWDNVAEYGSVWIPTSVPSGWAPYRAGHWVWIRPWGWTWVDDQPWGFAPFHYGRWAYVSNRWGWIPGPIHERPVYAPALVVFVGGPQGFQIGGGPGVAWFPLGFGEVFVPAYRVTPRYVTRVNVSNTVVQVTRVTTVYNYYNTNNRRQLETVTYANRRAPNSVTAVSRETFVNARPVNRNVVRVSEAEIARAPVERQVAIQPVKASVAGPNAAARVRPPAAVAERQVIAKRTPPAPVRALDDRPNVRPNQPGNNPGNNADNRGGARNPLVKAAPAVREKSAQQKQEEQNKASNVRPQGQNPNDNRSPDSHRQTVQPNPQSDQRQAPLHERRDEKTQPEPKTAPQVQPDRRSETPQPRQDNPQVDRRQAEPRPEVPQPEPKSAPQPNQRNQTPQPRPETPQPDRQQPQPRRDVPQPEPRKDVTPPERREVPRPSDPGRTAPTPEPRREVTPPDSHREVPRAEPGKQAPAPHRREVPQPAPQKEPPQDEEPQPPNQI